MCEINYVEDDLTLWIGRQENSDRTNINIRIPNHKWEEFDTVIITKTSVSIYNIDDTATRICYLTDGFNVYQEKNIKPSEMIER